MVRYRTSGQDHAISRPRRLRGDLRYILRRKYWSADNPHLLLPRGSWARTGLGHRASRTGGISPHLAGGVVKVRNPAIERIAAAGTAFASEVSVAIIQADAALVDSRIFASDIAQPLHREPIGVGPIKGPPVGTARSASDRCRTHPRAEKGGGRLLADIDDNSVSVVEGIHRMPGHLVDLSNHRRSSAPPSRGMIATSVPFSGSHAIESARASTLDR